MLKLNLTYKSLVKEFSLNICDNMISIYIYENENDEALLKLFVFSVVWLPATDDVLQNIFPSPFIADRGPCDHPGDARLVSRLCDVSQNLRNSDTG